MEEPSFYRVKDEGRVHVLKKRILNPAIVEEGTEPKDHTEEVVAAMFAWWVAWCGRRDPIYPPNGTIEVFHDADICTRCYHAYPIGERDKLFEHPLPLVEPEDVG